MTQTLPQYITEALSVPHEQKFAERLGAPAWRFTSSTQMLERARAIAFALRGAGLQPGDRVVIMSENRVDWLAADFGILLAGCVVVPVFATLALDQVEYIFKDSEAKLAFVETGADVERLARACPSAPRCIIFDGTGPNSLAEFEREGAAAAQSSASGVESFTSDIGPEKL